MVDGVFGPGKCHLEEDYKHAGTFPTLVWLLASYFLAIPETSALSERWFSAAGGISTPSRAGVMSTAVLWSPIVSNETWIYFRVLHKRCKKSKS
jgi:hypothetical protein